LPWIQIWQPEFGSGIQQSSKSIGDLLSVAGDDGGGVWLREEGAIGDGVGRRIAAEKGEDGYYGGFELGLGFSMLFAEEVLAFLILEAVDSGFPVDRGFAAAWDGADGDDVGHVWSLLAEKGVTSGVSAWVLGGGSGVRPASSSLVMRSPRAAMRSRFSK